MFLDPFPWLRPWMFYAAICAFIGFLCLGVAIHQRHIGRDEGRAEIQAVLDKAIAKHNAAAAAASESYREQERWFNQQRQEAENARTTEQATNDRLAAELRSSRDGLRNQLSAYAAGSGAASGDSITACRQRAATLGEQLGAGLPIQEELASRAETCAADLRAVLRAWPSERAGSRP